MLTLADAAVFFDRTEIFDADTNALVGVGQLTPFDDSKRDAAAAYRRILSVAPGLALPVAVRIMGDTFLVGARELDGLEGPLRAKYILQSSVGHMGVGRLGDFLAAAPAAYAWLALDWLKDGKEVQETSAVLSIFTVFAPLGTDLREHDIVWGPAGAYLLQVPRPEPSGLLAATAVRLGDAAPTQVQLQSRRFDPVAGGYVLTQAASVPALVTRWENLYVYDIQSDARYENGDVTIVLPPGTAVGTTDLLSQGGRDWRVVTVDQVAGAPVVQGRPA